MQTLKRKAAHRDGVWIIVKVTNCSTQYVSSLQRNHGFLKRPTRVRRIFTKKPRYNTSIPVTCQYLTRRVNESIG